MKLNSMTRFVPSFLCFSFLFFILQVGLVFSAQSATTGASTTGKEKIPPLSTDVNISKQDFEGRTEIIKDVPNQDGTLAFQIRLPKGWIRQESDNSAETIGADIFRQVALYISPPRLERRSVFRIRTIDLHDLITPDNWFWGYVMHMGFAVEGMTIESPRSVKAQYTLFEDGEPFVTRAAIMMSGSRIVMAEYLVHQDAYEAERGEQVWAMTGFDLENPSTKMLVKMKTFTFADISKFDYPENWVPYSPGITNINRMDASVIRVVNSQTHTDNGTELAKEQMIGRIDVSVVSKDLKTKLSEEISWLNQGLEEKSYKLGDYIGNVSDIKLDPLIKDSRLDVYVLDSTKEKLVGYEYWVAVLHTQSRYYFVRLITVSREENFVTWAQNAETFKYLLASISPASTGDSD